jgi:hypothetical protein
MFCVAAKVVLVVVMKAYRWDRGIAPFILNLGNRWRWWSTPRHGHLIRGEVTAVLWHCQGSSVKLKVLENKQICTCRQSKSGSAIPQRRKEKWKTGCAKAIGQTFMWRDSYRPYPSPQRNTGSWHTECPRSECLHVRCVSGQCITELVFCISSGVLPDDDPFSVETCGGNKEDQCFSVLPVALISARAGVYIRVLNCS